MPEDGFQEKATTRIESTAGRGTNDSAKETNDTSSNRRNIDKILKYAPDTKWITDKLSWPFLKPVIRASVSSWICLIFILVQKTEQSLGQAGFLVILAGFIEPPNSPFISVIERQLVMVAFATTAWAWSCLGLKLASLARTEIIPASKVSTTAVFAGAYLEAAPAVICGLFLFTGIVVILFFKSRHGPGPFVYAFVLSCICLNIPLTTGLLFPYPNYSLGRSVVVPLFLQSAVSIICSIIILPETVNAQFIKRLRNIILPLREAIATQPSILATSPLTDDFDMTEFHAKLSVAESGFVPLAATARLLNRDISWGRLSAEDLNGLHDISRKLFLRCNGMEYFYKIIDTNKERFLGTALKTPVTTTMNTPESTRPPSPELHASNISDAAGVTSSASSTNSRKKNRKSRAHFHFPHIPLKVSMFPDISHYNQSHENVVGVFESQKYLNLEARLTHPDTERLTENAIVLLAQSITPLLKACIESLDFFADWLSSVNESRLNVEHIFSRGKRKKWEERVRDSEMALENLEAALNNFRAKERLFILEPYRSEGDPQLTGPRSDAPPHRYLFNSFVYQYNVMYFAMRLVDFLQEVVRFEKERRHNQFWIPKVPLDALFHWSDSDVREEAQGRGDEDPDTIHGYTKRGFDLGETGARDPDALPPHNIFELLGDAAHRFLSGLQGGNTTFALKAGVLTLLLSLPSWITQSAHFAYTNKAVWAIFVGQLSLARFRGDTSFALFARLSSTLFGGVLGLVVWYISAGSGKGNAFGLAATCAVVFPLIIFYRSYSPGPPMTTIVFSTTVAIVIGYSWQDQHLISPSSPGVGASVVWRRFLLVAVGVTAAL